MMSLSIKVLHAVPASLRHGQSDSSSKRLDKKVLSSFQRNSFSLTKNEQSTQNSSKLIGLLTSKYGKEGSLL